VHCTSFIALTLIVRWQEGKDMERVSFPVGILTEGTASEALLVITKC